MVDLAPRYKENLFDRYGYEALDSVSTKASSGLFSML